MEPAKGCRQRAEGVPRVAFPSHETLGTALSQGSCGFSDQGHHSHQKDV